MKAGKYTIQELFFNRYIEQIIIPEIQRDYVWQQEQIEGLLSSISDDFQRFKKAKVPTIDADLKEKDESFPEDFEVFYRRRNHSSSIGFVYAYSDSQYEGHYFLIDGQQRITTIFLTLLVLASRGNKNKKDEFKKYYCNGERSKLNYRVRESASDFLSRLVPFYLDKYPSKVKDQAWCLESFSNDVTVSNMLACLDIVTAWLENKNSAIDEAEFFDYLGEYTELWYFDTNISAQGEQLYIYLNARGENVQANENLKAEMLSRLSTTNEKEQRGKEWEDWQDFFWKNRSLGKDTSANPNADIGFNEFLSCITGLKVFLKPDDYKDLKSQKPIVPDTVMQAKVLKIEDISNWLKPIIYIHEYKNDIEEKFTYSGWIDTFLEEFWQCLNINKTAWVIDYSDDNRSTERSRMVFVWGVLLWVSRANDSDKDISPLTIFRGIRQFYLRYKNNNRLVVGQHGIEKSIEHLLNDGFISKEEGREEYIKERWLANLSETDRVKFESLLWELEDHPYNLDGSDVGMLNVSHLVTLDSDLTYDHLLKIKEAFFECFPVSEAQKSNKNFPIIQSVLLHYGVFYTRISPWYYENYEFSNWKKNIRPLTKKDEERGNEFRIFLTDFAKSQLSIASFLSEKRTGITIGSIDTNSLHGQLLWYNCHLEESMWEMGGYIALSESSDNKKDKAFDSQKPFWNTPGSFRSESKCRMLADCLDKGMSDAPKKHYGQGEYNG